MKLIIGLGNPGREYAGTRHNIGFDSVIRLCDDYHISLDTKKHKGLIGTGVIAGEKVLLIQPQTYMNLSGECVRAALDFYKLTNEDIIVIYDDVALPLGQLRIRERGSAGGHNGIKNIIQHLGTEEFLRIRVGVDAKPDKWDMKDFVLGHFAKEDEPVIREALKNVSEAVKMILTEGAGPAMSRYNKKPVDPEEEKRKAEERAAKLAKRREEQAKRRAEAEARLRAQESSGDSSEESTAEASEDNTGKNS